MNILKRILGSPEPPVVKQVYEVPSFTSKRSYTVTWTAAGYNTRRPAAEAWTCTCRDWQIQSQGHREGLKYQCKHVRGIIAQEAH